MSCGCCGQPEKLCRCPKNKKAPEMPKRACIKECSDCDPCQTCESMVKICSFVVPNLEEGQTFRNSFIYNQEDDSVYYITDDNTPIRFGSSPMFIDAFDPTTKQIPRQTVYDFDNNVAFVFAPDGTYRTFTLSDPNSTSVEISDEGGPIV